MLNLSQLDELSFLISAACHDLGHDGFNNSWHINAMTDRAIDSNEGSVQEFYHTAEFFRILADDDVNFLIDLPH